MRFYVPEWDDHVDAQYDFRHDEHSALDRTQRELAYIWDFFDRSETPIDGVLISREQVEESPAKFNRLTSNGVYDAPMLDLPEWLPTISDCGAWGYKQFPFPPYWNEAMLDFYEQLDVSVGVTIDHLVLGSGHSARLYLDERAFTDAFTTSDIPDTLSETVDDIMIDAWPDTWPPYVDDYEPSIRSSQQVDPFGPELFEGAPDEVLARLADDPRAVYRDDDMQFRYELTLDNAEEMRDLYDANSYAFRPMVAIQGWDADSYVKATEEVLEMGYQYIGIGGVAGSPEEVVKDIVSAVGNTITAFEREHNTRIDIHVFGFAKTGAFDTIGRSGVTSFDSASMLRAAWTGGENYHLDSDRRYDAIRVQYPKHSADLATAIETAIRGQELLHALRAFDREDSIVEAVSDWYQSAANALAELPDYLERNRWSDTYEHRLLRVIEERFREEYQHGRQLKASFSDAFRTRLVKLLRDDDSDNPIPWERYLELISQADSIFDNYPSPVISDIRSQEAETDEVGTFEHLWPLVESYVEYIGNDGHLAAYKELLQTKPWRDCPCPICNELGIEVAIFRGNNRNRRRGFHNTRRFYDQFEASLPRLLVLTRPSAQLSGADTVEEYLATKRSAFWTAVRDLPVAEIGIMTADGVYEWWEPPPNRISFDPAAMANTVAEYCIDYQEVFLDESARKIDGALTEQLEAQSCIVRRFDEPHRLRLAVSDRLGFQMQSLLSGY